MLKQKFVSVANSPLSIKNNAWADAFFLLHLGDSFFWLHFGGKTLYGLLVTSGCLFSRKVWWVVSIGSFCPKLRYFTGQNGAKGWGTHIKINFWLFSNKKINVTNRAEKVDEKKWAHLFSFHVSFLSYGLQIVQKGVLFTILCLPQQKI